MHKKAVFIAVCIWKMLGTLPIVRYMASSHWMFNQLTELVEATDVANEIRLEACGLLGNITRSPAPTHSQRVGLCARLFDRDAGIATAARQALSYAVSSLEVREAVIDARGLDYLAELLASPNTGVREWTRGLLVDLGFHRDKCGYAHLKKATWISLVPRLDSSWSWQSALSDWDPIYWVLKIFAGGGEMGIPRRGINREVLVCKREVKERRRRWASNQLVIEYLPLNRARNFESSVMACSVTAQAFYGCSAPRRVPN
ncbi:hypothetical protein B0H14DRAFT_2626444 [Mycena olivaceomarginata]|nr:hypothetical protein B0H14DRAFT_2626444 [Mycena olivaceomarginata]